MIFKYIFLDAFCLNPFKKTLPLSSYTLRPETCKCHDIDKISRDDDLAYVTCSIFEVRRVGGGGLAREGEKRMFENSDNVDSDKGHVC